MNVIEIVIFLIDKNVNLQIYPYIYKLLYKFISLLLKNTFIIIIYIYNLLYI